MQLGTATSSYCIVNNVYPRDACLVEQSTGSSGMPDTWTKDAERMMRARVRKDRQAALTKPEIAIEEIDRVIASGVRFGCVLADVGYGSSSAFRQALSERGLLWAVGGRTIATPKRLSGRC